MDKLLEAERERQKARDSLLEIVQERKLEREKTLEYMRKLKNFLRTKRLKNKPKDRRVGVSLSLMSRRESTRNQPQRQLELILLD